MRCRLLSTSLALLACSSTARSFAQDAAQAARFRLSPVHPASAPSPFVTIEGPAPAAPLPSLAASLTLDYARAPLSLEVSGEPTRTVPLVDHAFVLHSDLAAQLTRSLLVDLSWSFAAVQSGQDQWIDDRRFRAPSNGAAGDLRIGALHRGWLTTHVGHVAGARGWLPVGDETDFMSDDRFRVELLAGLFADSGALRMGCNLFGSPRFDTGAAGERLGGACAGDVQVVAHGPRIGAEIWAAALRVDPDVDTGSILEFLATAGQDFGPMRFTLGVGRGVGTSPGTSALRAIGMLRIVPQSAEAQASENEPDRDMDRIADNRDRCPDEAGPASIDPERHGCPIRDTDGDGIDDHNDACPETKGAKYDDPETDGCPDMDNDRVVDTRDACPREPAPSYEGATQRGCPRYARLDRDTIVLSPALDPLGEQSKVEQIVLREVAFIMRTRPDITKVAVEVRLTVPEGRDEAEVAELAVQRARAFVDRLVQMGVERRRLDPVGALGHDPGVRLLIVDRRNEQPRPP